MRVVRNGRAFAVGAALLLIFALLAFGHSRAFAATPTQQVMDFGENLWGQLGNGPDPLSDPSLKVVTFADATGSPIQVAAGWDHSIVLTSTGQVYTAGTGGALGGGSRFDEFRHPTAITLSGLSGLPVQAAAGGSLSLVLTSEGQVYSFGNDDSGQLGNGTVSNEEDATPAVITLPGATGPAVQVAAGREFSLVVTSTGQLYAFGENGDGQLGNPEGWGSYPTPEEVTLPGAMGPVVQVAAGEYHTIALTSSGQLYTFGSNEEGQLGNGSSSRQQWAPAEIALPGATGLPVQVAAGWEDTMVLTSTGQLYMFGNNTYGQLGNGTSDTSSHATPEAITLPGATGSIVQIAAGREDSLVVTSTGQLYTFGRNTFGELGMGANDEEAHPTPTLVQQLPPVTAVALGSAASYTLALTDVPLEITTRALPEGTVGIPYVLAAAAVGGDPPLHWSATGLPSGLSIDSASGQISGIPTTAGTSVVKLTAADADGVEAHSASLVFLINAAPSGGSQNQPGGSDNNAPEGSNSALGDTGNAAPGGSSGASGGSGNSPGGTANTLGSASTALVSQIAPTTATGTLQTFDTKNALTTLQLVCNGVSGQRCSGRVTLTAHEQLRGKKLLALSAGERRAAVKIRTITLGTSTYTILAGNRGTVTLSLNASAKRLLAAHGTLPATLTLTGTIKATRRLSVTLPGSAHKR
jgi:alpha-tubulin suppressor-like RCC1 family protein